MEIKTNSIRNHNANDEYFIPFEPNHAVALTMNFPQFPESNASNVTDIQTDFDYNCPDCLADLFGPIMAPYAALQQQTADYRLRLEHIAYRRYIAMKSQLINSFEKDFKRKWKKTFRHPFKYDITAFLSGTATMGRYVAMISNGWTFIVSICLLFFAVYLILVSDQRQPMLTFIRTFSKFYRTFFFQGIIGCLTVYSILLMIGTLCSSLGALVCSFSLTLFGILTLLISLTFAIALPILLFIYKPLLTDKLEGYMRVSISDFDNLPQNPVTIFWNELQTKYSCCGIDDSILNYRASYFHQLTGEILPSSCCRPRVLCAGAPTIANSFLNRSCLPQAERLLDLAFMATAIGSGFLIVFLIIAVISSGLFFCYINSAKEALNEHNEFIIKSMISTLEEYDQELAGYKHYSNQNQSNFREKQRIRGILPITPTVVRVKNPRIINYLGFS